MDNTHKKQNKIAAFVLPLTPKVVILSSLPLHVVGGTFLFLVISLLSFKLSDDLKRRRNERKERSSLLIAPESVKSSTKSQTHPL